MSTLVISHAVNGVRDLPLIYNLRYSSKVNLFVHNDNRALSAQQRSTRELLMRHGVNHTTLMRKQKHEPLSRLLWLTLIYFIALPGR